MAKKLPKKPIEEPAINDNTSRTVVSPDDIVVDGYTQDSGQLVDETSIKRKSGFFARWPAWLRAFVLNLWFGGAVCYFIVMGIFDTVGYWASVLVLGLSYGLASDILLAVLLKAIIPSSDDFSKVVLYHSKKFYSVLINCVYNVVIAILIMLCYAGLNMAMQSVGDAFWAVGPLLMGLLYASLNLGFVSLKNLTLKLAKKYKK